MMRTLHLQRQLQPLLPLPLLLLLTTVLKAPLPLLPIPTASGQRYDVRTDLLPLVERRRIQVFAVADTCVSQLGTSLGEPFLDCVLGRLEEAERDGTGGDGDDKAAAADEDDDDDEFGPFPVPPYTRHPLTIDERASRRGGKYDGANHPLMLMDLLRNYTCSRDVDGGSPVLKEVEWTYDEKEVMTELAERSCPANLGVDSSDGEGEDTGGGIPWEIRAGYLPGGDDACAPKRMDVESAKRHCDGLPRCEGFTFHTGGDGGRGESDPPEVYFKSRADVANVGRDHDWTTYVRKKIPAHCLADYGDDPSSSSPSPKRREYAPPKEYRIEILRHEPLVAVIPNFATQDECDLLVEAGGSLEEMGRAFESGARQTSYRRSYSSNIDVDYDDINDPITRFAQRMFAMVRGMTGYDVHGPGQEPINAVLYRDVGDEYRPHCDGPCHGGRYIMGQRVATSILYCMTSDGGGQTSFTRSGMMVSPRPRDLLLFTYKYENGTVDDGFTEHSGCPIGGGRKWIATQWYREGVDHEHPWNTMTED